MTDGLPNQPGWLFETYRGLQARSTTELWLGGYTPAAVGTRPPLRVSRDAGVTWEPICWPGAIDGGGLVSTVRFSGPLGLAAGTGGGRRFLIRTGDGGQHWEEAHLVPPGPPAASAAVLDVTDIAFAGGEHVWLAAPDGPPFLYRSTDSGRTFSPQPGPEAVTAARRVFFVDQAHGWVWAGDGLFATTDGGATWVPATPPVTEIADMWFVDPLHGVVLANAPGTATTPNSGAVLATSDGGQTWTTVLDSDDTTFHRVTFVDRQRGFLGAGRHGGTGTSAGRIEGRFFATEDGGQTWQLRAELGPARDLGAVDFADADHGWAMVTNRPCLLSTVDGGRTWVRTPLAGSAPAVCEG